MENPIKLIAKWMGFWLQATCSRGYHSVNSNLTSGTINGGRPLATQKKLLIPIIVPIDENENPFWHEVKAGVCAITL